MVRLELLDAISHGDVRIRTQPDARLGDARHFVPIVVGEFARLAAHYPILLTKSAETGAFFIGAMLGIEAGENLFLKPSGGQDSYRPLEMRRGPFFISGDNLAIDMDHPRVSRAEGEPLFDPDRQPSGYLRDVQSIITQLQQGLDETAAFVELLLTLKLVEPIDISLGFDDGSRFHLESLYTISSDRLHALPDERILELFHRGHLRLIHTMIGSLDQIPALATMRNNRIAEGA